MNKLPSIAILTGTYNPDAALLEKMLRSVRTQKYRGRLYHYFLDAGSTNSLKTIARKYKCNLYSFKFKTRNRIRFILPKIKEDLLLFLEADNILPQADWLERMVEPILKEGVFASYPAYNTYRQDMDILTRYFALIGAPDPTLYYLNKSDKIPMNRRVYDKGNALKRTAHYSVVRFTADTLPTMGDNGFLVTTSVIRKYLNKPSYIHPDVFASLLHEGYNTYGVVNNSVIHVSKPNILKQVLRRVEVKKEYSDKMRGSRKYLVYNHNSKTDRLNLFKYIVFSITFVEPLYVSIRGYMDIHDLAWFLHPIMCVFMTIAYGWSEVVFLIRNRLENRKR